MNLAQLKTAVYTQTNRPDLLELTEQSILAATLNLHTLDFWFKDIVPMQLVFDQARYIQTLDTSLFARWRQLAYFRKFDPSANDYQQGLSANVPWNWGNQFGFLKVLTPDNILDSYGTEKLDVCYQAGMSVYIKSSTSLRYGMVGFYQYPNIEVANYSSWIAEQHPFAIIYFAASIIFQSTGQHETARKFDRPADPRNINDQGGLVQQQIDIIRRNNVVAQGW